MMLQINKECIKAVKAIVKLSKKNINKSYSTRCSVVDSKMMFTDAFRILIIPTILEDGEYTFNLVDGGAFFEPVTESNLPNFQMVVKFENFDLEDTKSVCLSSIPSLVSATKNNMTVNYQFLQDMNNKSSHKVKLTHLEESPLVPIYIVDGCVWWLLMPLKVD